MEKKTAEKIMIKVIESTAPLNELVEILNEVEDRDEQRVCRRHLGNVIALICDELIDPIVREYPELSPDSAFWRKNRERP